MKQKGSDIKHVKIHGNHEVGEGGEREEYFDTDIINKVIKQLKALGIDASISDAMDVNDRQYYSYYFTSMPRVVTSIGYIKVEGMNFDYIQILARG
jgi:hypothetical protein